MTENLENSEGFNIRPEAIVTTFEALLDKFNGVESGLKLLSVRVHPESRIGKYKKAVEEAIKTTPEYTESNSEVTKVYSQSLIELDQLELILAELPRNKAIPDLQFRLQQIVSGKELPEMENDLSSSRDFQMELYLASILQKSGYSIELNEPDITVESSKFKIGIAVKRPKSAKKIGRNFSDACSQIEKSPYDGIVAMDLSRLLNRKNTCYKVKGPNQIVDRLEHSANHFIDKNHPNMLASMKSGKVIGVKVYVGAVFYDEEMNMFGSVARWVTSNLCPLEDDRVAIIKEITRSTGKVLIS